MNSKKKIHYMICLIFLLFLNGCSDFSEQNSFGSIHDLKGLHLITQLKDGNLIALSEDASSNNTIYIVDRDGDNRVELINSSSKKLIYSVTLAEGNWVVYSEATNDMVCADWEIKTINIDTKETYTIDYGKVKSSDLKVGTTTFMAPLLDSFGSKVVWSTFEQENGNSCIAVVRLYDLNSKVSEIIDQTNKPSEEFGHPKIEGNLIVYDRGQIDKTVGGRRGTMIIKNMDTNETQEIDNGVGVCEGNIKYPFIVWNSGNHIKLYNIQSKNVTVISENSIGWTPSINDKYVTWLSNESGINLYKLPTGPNTFVFQGRTVIGGTINGNLLYWPKKSNDIFTTEYVDLSNI